MFDYSKRTYIMGILNVTPDSFSDGGDFNNIDKAINRAKEMVREGVDIIDLGGESTRPGHKYVEADEEIKRIIPVIKELKKEVNVPISVDTYKAKVADEALKLGVEMINDIWGLKKDKDMASTIAKYDAHVCIMHNQDGTNYDGDIIEEMKKSLLESIEIGLNAGIKKEKIVLDPGIGFGKNVEQNLEVLRRLDELNSLGYPILLGTSRKSVIGHVLNVEPKERLEGTIATTVLGIRDGISIVRVHDVKENLMAAKMADAIYRK
ncbi:dihydropteroate synthase [Romboutsia sp. 1001216sp1]|uniref:dihydropteroate synthase n=1 Tax=Romboutsia TaxID=1501226 RepID=UPI000ACF28A5|nr:MULTISPECIES: dihydropteroate synthase [Romboutsia]MDB8790954.1 dihydropteroate synthase [Romboutsia sp. 1001216sp1]MDB8793632.1 dihydropteroate synthase [Romboutsia sp. 1001216sp1]MDB8795029.1 dihydropteroate synthase [Romboutsia sp. 1001216sp1]MDB8798839.1 dihydropteroate synthase [Romboutsia sp. 1001216sp1]MDB8801642.1 dihydropteroate synthase [Romboutsia sp. 1001216sp1]